MQTKVTKAKEYFTRDINGRRDNMYTADDICKLMQFLIDNRRNDLILIMTPEKQDKTLELCKHWSPDSTLVRNEVIMKTAYPVNQ